MAASATAHNFMYFMLQMVAKTHTNTNQQQQQQQQPSLATTTPHYTHPQYAAHPSSLLPASHFSLAHDFHAHLRRLTNFIKWQFNQSILTANHPMGLRLPTLCWGGGMDRGHFTVMLTYTITQLKRTQEKQRKRKKSSKGKYA